MSKAEVFVQASDVEENANRVNSSALSQAGMPNTTALTGTAMLSVVSEGLVKIWQDLLHVSQVKPDDDFFDLGGDSLAAIRMLEHIGREFGEELVEPDIIYTASCFSDLAETITTALAQRDMYRAPDSSHC